MRRHTHDVRNGLNSLDLETELLLELAPEGEAADSAGRIRKQLRGLAQHLRGLAALFQDPLPTVVKTPARVLLKIWREKHAALTPAPEVQWVDELQEEEVNADVEMMATVFRELLTNAAVYSPGVPLTIIARAQSGEVTFELREPKPTVIDVSTWGQPFSTTRRDHYGLGLWTARRLMAASGVSFVQSYCTADNCLLSRLVLAVV